MAREIESSPQTTEDEDARGMVLCCYGVKFVKRGASIEGRCKSCPVISKYILWSFCENLIKDEYSTCRCVKNYLIGQNVYDSDVLFARVNGICAVT